MKQPYKALLAFYTLFLLWLVLFKTSSDPVSVLATYQSRGLNLLPFNDFSSSTWREMADNFVVFVPLGLLLGTTYKQVSLRRKLVYILVFSIAVEVIQFIFAIGTTDITDVIMNTLGGLFGLMAYKLVDSHVDTKKLDLCIAVALAFVLTTFLLLRFMVFKVRY